MPRIQPALYASLSVLVVNLLLCGWSMFQYRLPQTGGYLFASMLIQQFASLLCMAGMVYVVPCQLQRLMRRPALKRPTLFVVVFCVLMVILISVKNIFFGDLVMILMGNASAESRSILLTGISALVGEGVVLVITLLSAVIALLVAGRRDAPEMDAGQVATWIVQALTVAVGMSVTNGIVGVLSLGSFMGAGMNSPSQVNVLSCLVPLFVAVLAGGGVYACWPRRLQQASGWALLLWGAGVGLVGTAGAAMVGVLAMLQEIGGGASWFSLLVWPAYVLCCVVAAALAGWIRRERRAVVPV